MWVYSKLRLSRQRWRVIRHIGIKKIALRWRFPSLRLPKSLCLFNRLHFICNKIHHHVRDHRRAFPMSRSIPVTPPGYTHALCPFWGSSYWLPIWDFPVRRARNSILVSYPGYCCECSVWYSDINTGNKTHTNLWQVHSTQHVQSELTLYTVIQINTNKINNHLSHALKEE